MNKKLSIILPTKDRLHILKQSINSINKFIKFDYDLIVVDGESTDGTQEFLKEIPCNLIVRKPSGVIDANNIGFSQVKTPYVVFMSDDMILLRDNFSVGIEILQKNPDIGLIGLKIRERSSSKGVKIYAGGVSRFGILTANFQLASANLIRRTGVFSEEYHTYIADSDLTLKVLLSGQKVVHIKPLTAEHLIISEIDRDPKEKLKDFLKGEQIYLKRYHFFTSYSSLDDSLKSKFKRKIKFIMLNLLFFRRITLFGYVKADIWNTWRSKYINNLDPILNLKKKYHLVQKLPDKFISENFEKIKEIIGD